MEFTVEFAELTGLEQRVWRCFARGEPLDLRTAGGEPDGTAGPDRRVRADVLAELLAGPQRPEGRAALRLAGAVITGSLRLEAARVPVLVELTACEFETCPDLRMAELAGLRLTGCRLPGLLGHNLRVTADLVLDELVATGPVELADARIDGSLRLAGATLRRARGTAVAAERIVVRGTLAAHGLQATSEVRIRGGRIGGDLDLRGAQLTHPDGDALDATGLQLDGSLRCDFRGEPFRCQGRLLLAGARVGGDAVFTGARLDAAPGEERTVLVLPRGVADTAAALVGDRLAVHGNLELDDGFTASGTVRLPHANVGGYLRLSGATLRTLPRASNPAAATGQTVPVALVADGVEIGGDLEARARRDHRGRSDALRVHGQLRLVDARVNGSASLSGARLHGPGLDVLFADRLTVGGTLFLRRLDAAGSVRLQNAHIGSSLDCTGARLLAPRRRPDGSAKPSLDARAISVGKDLLCSHGFAAVAGVRLRLAEVSKLASFVGADLGGDGPVALNVYGMRSQELVLRFARAPRGAVQLTRATATSVFDDATLWNSEGTLDLEDFRYETLSAEPEVDVRTRLRWLERSLPDYDPDPYDALAASYRDGGHDELADRVLLAKQRRRHGVMGPAGRVWGRMQEWTVGYGYRPWLAACWLGVFWLAGALWFTGHRLPRLNTDADPAWNPWLFAADLLVPVVNFGHDGMWRTDGASAWVASLLTVLGWTLASTAAAGATRVLRRN